MDFAPIAVASISLIVSILFAILNHGIAKRALRLSERQEARQGSQIDLYLHDSISWRAPQGERSILGVHLLVTNPADRGTSIVDIELYLTYTVNDNLVTAKVPHASQRGVDTAFADTSTLELPTTIPANDAAQGWVIFEVADGLTGGRPVERYQVVVRDVHHALEAREVLVFRELANDETS